MTKEELAKKLDGRQYGNELTGADIDSAKENGLIVVYGASDDLMEMEGSISDEFGTGKVYVYKTKSGVKALDGDAYDELKEDIEENELDLDLPNQFIKPVWCPEGIIKYNDKEYDSISWIYKTNIPHSTFIILEDDEPYCQGIVFSTNDLK